MKVAMTSTRKARLGAGIGNSVGAEGLGQVRCGDGLGEQEKEGACDQCADDLSAPIAEGVFPTHSAG